MANRFSDIAKKMGVKVPEEELEEKKEETAQEDQLLEKKETKTKSHSRAKKKKEEKHKGQENEVITTRKTTALPLLLDIAIKEAKERRNIFNKINGIKKITEDDIIVEALEQYFMKTENRTYVEAAQEKIKFSE